ncbi:MAG: hypothetical protein R3E79_52755 [Caldilineaceae bacterium]
MSMIEVRLLELAIKGDRLDEINAEAALAAQARWQGRWQWLHLCLRRLAGRPASQVTSVHRTAHKSNPPLKPVV